MKRTVLLWVTGLALVAPLSAEEIQLRDVRLTHTTGQVTLTLEGVQGTPMIGGEMPLDQGDVIVTGLQGRAELSFDEGTLVRLLPNSVLTLKELTGKKTVLRLRRGVLLARVQFEKDTGQQFSVLTPSTMASVRGTEFVVDQTGARTIIGVLNEGHVAVQAYNFKKHVVMHFNQEVTVNRSAPPGRVQVLTKLYPHKVQMADMRDRIKQLNRSATALSPQQRAMLRAGWKQTQSSSVRPNKPAKAAKRARPTPPNQ